MAATSRKRILGLIPAKGGSVRLARKNVRMLGDKSLLGWAAAAARASGLIERLIVSTEDAGVAEHARGLGIEVPFIRPLELARDPAGVVDVALHALAELESQGNVYDTLFILLPTCPFRSAEDMLGAHAMFLSAGAKFLMSVSEFSHTPYAAMSLGTDGLLTGLFPDKLGKKSQELPKAYRCNGAMHILDIPAFRAAKSYYATPLVGFPMPRDRSIDIDTEADLREAEALLHGRAG